LIAFVLVPIIACAMLLGVWAFGVLEERLTHRLQREVEMVARALQLPMGDALSDQGSRGVRLALDSAFAIGRVYGAYVYDGNGELVGASAPRGGKGAASDVSDVIATGERTGQYDEVDGRRVYSYFVPLNSAGGEMIGVLRVTRKESELSAYVDELRNEALLLVSVTAVILTGIVLLGYYAAAGRSLGSFARSIRRVATGDRAHRVTVRGPREIGAVGDLFNQMLDSLNRSEKLAERERRNRQSVEEQLRHSERLATIGQVTTGLAHELGTPLSTVSGHAERMLRRAEIEAPVRKSLEIVRAQTARMERLVRQLLDYGGKQAPSRDRSEAQSLIAAAADALAPLIESTGVGLVMPEDPAVEIEGDRDRLEQALINLIRNALQAATRRVEVQCRTVNNHVLFIVDDDGQGVNPEIRARLTEPFVTDKQASGGTGLGLAICASVAEAHGGTLHDTRSPLGGARFVLTILRKSDQGHALTSISDHV
jgi:signal transduction histidine kinase